MRRHFNVIGTCVCACMCVCASVCACMSLCMCACACMCVHVIYGCHSSNDQIAATVVRGQSIYLKVHSQIRHDT